MAEIVWDRQRSLMKANSSAPLRWITLPPRIMHGPKRIRTKQITEARMAKLAEKNAKAKDTTGYAMMAAKDQPPSLPFPAPANDATREKQIPFRRKQKCAHQAHDDLPIVEGEDDELVGRPQKKIPVRQTKGELYVS